MVQFPVLLPRRHAEFPMDRKNRSHVQVGGPVRQLLRDREDEDFLVARTSQKCEDRGMKVLNRRRLKEASRTHADAAEALSNWWQATQHSQWATFSDVRRTFNSASYV